MITNVINNWKPEVNSLINRLTKAGCTILSQDNGEYQSELSKVGRKQFVEDLIACDEARLFVRTPSGKVRGLYLVLGNSPGELVCDYNCDPVLDTVTEAHYQAWDGRKQPMCASPY